MKRLEMNPLYVDDDAEVDYRVRVEPDRSLVLSAFGRDKYGGWDERRPREFVLPRAASEALRVFLARPTEPTPGGAPRKLEALVADLPELPSSFMAVSGLVPSGAAQAGVGEAPEECPTCGQQVRSYDDAQPPAAEPVGCRCPVLAAGSPHCAFPADGPDGLCRGCRDRKHAGHVSDSHVALAVGPPCAHGYLADIYCPHCPVKPAAEPVGKCGTCGGTKWALGPTEPNSEGTYCPGVPCPTCGGTGEPVGMERKP